MEPKDVKALIIACLESDYQTFYEIVKEMQYHYSLSLLDAALIVKNEIKQLAQEDNYLAIACCYKFQIPY